MKTLTEETVDVVPYLDRYGSEQVVDPKEGDQAWFDMALGGLRELRTLTNRVWVPQSDG